jgi:glyoxylase-like metal-dependent hydrolase (beta-lactamase superfamily II)
MMKTGDFELRTIDTGYFKLDGGAMFGVVPRILWEKTNPPDERNRIDMRMRALYIERGDRKILVDCGAGDKLDEKMVDIYDVHCGPLRSILEGYGIDPDSITDAVASHLHFDHAGGYTYYGDREDLLLALPNAMHHIQRKQWEAALSPNEKDRASFFPENIEPLRGSPLLHLIDGEEEIIPGVRVVPTGGHTPGHQVALIETENVTVMYCADLVPLASQINLPWIMAYDHFPLSTLEEKKELLGKAADEGWILFFEHDPEIEACRISRNSKGRFEISETVEIG